MFILISSWVSEDVEFKNYTEFFILFSRFALDVVDVVCQLVHSICTIRCNLYIYNNNGSGSDGCDDGREQQRERENEGIQSAFTSDFLLLNFFFISFFHSNVTSFLIEVSVRVCLCAVSEMLFVYLHSRKENINRCRMFYGKILKKGESNE